nr:hypothetical protein Iba_chr03cCG7380 [Ipomoea batatas]
MYLAVKINPGSHLGLRGQADLLLDNDGREMCVKACFKNRDQKVYDMGLHVGYKERDNAIWSANTDSGSKGDRYAKMDLYLPAISVKCLPVGSTGERVVMTLLQSAAEMTVIRKSQTEAIAIRAYRDVTSYSFVIP